MKIRAIPQASPLRQRGRTSDWMVRAGYKETDMSKNNDTSKLVSLAATSRTAFSKASRVSKKLFAAHHACMSPPRDRVTARRLRVVLVLWVLSASE